MMNTRLAGPATALLFVLAPAARAADEPAAWKELGKFKLPSAPVAVSVSADHRLAYVLTKSKITAPGPYRGQDYHVLRCLELESGKELFVKDLDMLGGQFAVSNYHFAY